MISNRFGKFNQQFELRVNEIFGQVKYFRIDKYAVSIHARMSSSLAFVPYRIIYRLHPSSGPPMFVYDRDICSARKINLWSVLRKHAEITRVQLVELNKSIKDLNRSKSQERVF